MMLMNHPVIKFLFESFQQVLMSFLLQYLLPAIVHINHQPFLEHGDGPIVSSTICQV